ncbi:hypothetical protein [Streptacidiphilus sp. MAP5-3]|uniref:hypothetical protein n=1 Tax=unclassified Streptacidiphilus TaxID=2643834 RepID=UPI003512D478
MSASQPAASSTTSSGTPAAASSPTKAASADSALPSPWASQSGSPAQQAAAADALAAYRGMWSDLAALGQTPDGYKNPKLATHMLYAPLSQWSQELADNAKLDEITTGAPSIDPEVVKVGAGAKPTQVEIADCFDNSSWPVVNAKTRKPTDNKPAVRERSEAMVTLDTDGYWKVTQQVFAQAGSC